MKNNTVLLSTGMRVLVIALSTVLVVSLGVTAFLAIRNASLNEETADLADALADVTEENESLSAQLDAAQTTQPVTDTALADLQAEYDDYKQQMDAALETAAQELSALQAQYETLQADSQQTLADAVAAGQADVQAARDEDALALSELQAEYDTYKEESEASLASLTAEFDSFKSSSEQALSSANALVEANAQSEAALADLQTEYDTYKADSQAAQAEAAQALSDLQAEFDTYQADSESQLTALTQQYTALEDEYTAYQSEAEAALAAQEVDAQTLSALQLEFDTYQADSESQLESLTQQYTALETEYAALEAEYTAYESSAGSELTQAIADGEAAVQAAQEEAALALSDLQTELDTYKADAEAALAALAALEEDYETFKADSAVALSDATALATADSQAALLETEQTLAALQTEFDTYKTETADTLAALQTQLETYQSEAEEELAALQTEYAAYQSDTEAALAAAVASGEAALQAAQEEAALALDDLQTQFDTYKADTQAEQTEAETVQAETAQALTVAEQTIAQDQQEIALLSIPADENGAGNSANGMLALLYEGSIFYHNNYNKGNIYTENTAGYADAYQSTTDTNPIHTIYNIMGMYENYLYYCNNYRLYRVNLETGKIDTIFKRFYMRPWSGIQVIGDTLYFLNSAYDGDGEYMENLWSIDPKGKEPENVQGVLASTFVSDGELIYYASIDKQALIRLDPATGSETVLVEDADISCLNIAGDMLYFSLEGTLMKVKTDGTELSAIGDAQGEYLNVVGEFVYYANTADSGKLYRITQDGLYNEKLSDIEDVRYINIAGGWVYFMQYELQNDKDVYADTWKIRLDGSELMLAKP